MRPTDFKTRYTLLALVLQPSDLFLLGRRLAGGAFGDRMKGGRGIVEEDFLSGVDLVGLDPLLVV
jgi:hypothetical protein